MKLKKAFLPLIITGYALLYLATSKQTICDADCNGVYRLDTTLSGSKSYVYYVDRCDRNKVLDSLCVYVKDTAGINWNLLADTSCLIAQQVGLHTQQIFIIKAGSYPLDTLARKQCP